MWQCVSKQFVNTLTILFCVAAVILPTNILLAQSADSEAPVVIHRNLDAGIAGELLTFLSRVSDDNEVASVTLYYRLGNTSNYQSIPMRALPDAIGEYMIAVETTANSGSKLEYYIEASDITGNKASRGYSYAPIVIPLLKATQPATAVTTADPAPAPRVNRAAILLGIGAAVVLGALAAGESGADDAPNAPNVLINIITDSPTANQ